jgi:hypothetical protein
MAEKLLIAVIKLVIPVDSSAGNQIASRSSKG